jgi:release factor glutamine methyltransferase
VQRRLAREPVAYLLGRKAFRRIELAVDRRVLIPRPETELLVEVALELPPGARVHDVGTGSGAVALALADERPDLVVSASDASPGAVAVARDNAAALDLEVEISLADVLPPRTSGRDGTPGRSAVRGEWDLVVANLPYVRADEWDGLAPEIRLFEPRGALVAGADGLDAIRALISAAPAGLRVALEHAPAQAATVRALLDDPSTRRDLAGRERVTSGRVKP